MHKCDKSVKAKSQKVCGANSYVCSNYRGKTGTGWPSYLQSWIEIKLLKLAYEYKLLG